MTWCSLCAKRVEKVWVLAISVSIVLDLILQTLSLLMLVFPNISIVDTFCILELVEQLFVFIDYFGQVFDPVSPVQ